VYNRADLSRRVALVVAPFFTAASASAFAREFRAADTRNREYRLVQALRFTAASHLIERICKVE
jgi:hypothetical protein